MRPQKYFFRETNELERCLVVQLLGFRSKPPEKIERFKTASLAGSMSATLSQKKGCICVRKQFSALSNYKFLVLAVSECCIGTSFAIASVRGNYFMHLGSRIGVEGCIYVRKVEFLGISLIYQGGGPGEAVCLDRNNPRPVWSTPRSNWLCNQRLG